MKDVKAWVRGEDWISLAAGVYLSFAAMIGATVTAASANAYTMGPVIVVLALLALAFPKVMTIEWLKLLAGVWVFIAPWVLGFSHVTAASWNAWVIGVIVAAFSAARLTELNSRDATSTSSHGTHLPHAA